MLKKIIQRVSKSLAVINKIKLRLGGAKVAHSAFIDFSVSLKANKITIGEGVIIKKGTKIICDTLVIDDHVYFAGNTIIEGLREFNVGEYCIFHSGCHFRGQQALRIGQNCWFGNNAFVNVHRNVTIGNNCGLGQDDMLWTHGFFAEEIEGYPVKFGEIVLEDNVWLTPRVTVLPGVRIGEKAIVSTGAVVTKSLEGQKLYAGVPAKEIMSEEKYRKYYTLTEKINMTKRIFLERINAKTKEIEPNITYVTLPKLTFYLIVSKTLDQELIKKIRNKEPDTEILVFTQKGLDNLTQILMQNKAISIFDFSSKIYWKSNIRCEILFKKQMNDRYIRFLKAKTYYYRTLPRA